MAFLRRPFRWLKAISRYRATSSGGPNFAFELCLRKIKPEEIATLDLSSWDVAFNGAEPIRSATLDAFADRFAPAGFRREALYPCYGLAETTLLSCGPRKYALPTQVTFVASALDHGIARRSVSGDEKTRTLVSVGSTATAHDIAIVNPDTFEVCPQGTFGEVWLNGPSVAGGYWKNPEATESTFNGRSPGLDGGYLRTGDIGFIFEDEVYINGRLKDLIIIRGVNHYPQDIEQTVEGAHPDVKKGCLAAFSTQVDGDEAVALVTEVVEAREDLPVDEIVAAIRKVVASEHQVEVHSVVLIKPKTIPKTSSGKIQRYACREALTGFDEDVLARRIGR